MGFKIGKAVSRIGKKAKKVANVSGKVLTTTGKVLQVFGEALAKNRLVIFSSSFDFALLAIVFNRAGLYP